jgi:hypothetical protein
LHAHKGTLLISILKEINRIHIITPHFPMIHFNIILLPMSVPHKLMASDFPTKIWINNSTLLAVSCMFDRYFHSKLLLHSDGHAGCVRTSSVDGREGHGFESRSRHGYIHVFSVFVLPCLARKFALCRSPVHRPLQIIFTIHICRS